MENLSYTKHELAVTGTAFAFGPADAIYFAKTIVGGVTVRTLDGSDINYTIPPIGKTIRIACVLATFDSGPTGAVVAMRYPSPARDT